MRTLTLGAPFVVSCALLVGAAQNARPLPDERTFFAEVRQNLASDEALQLDYTFKERRTEVRRNAQGQEVPTETKVFEVYPSAAADLTYYRLVEVDGKPVPPGDLAAADARQLAKIADLLRKRQAESDRDSQRREDRAAEDRAKDRAMLADVLAVQRFSLERREFVGGRSMIVISFEPRTRARPATREGRLAQHFRGLVWVDEEERQVARVTSEAVDTISMGLGVVLRLNDDLRGRFDRRRLPDGAWLPARAELTGTGRILLVKKIEIGYIYEYFDYVGIDPNMRPRFVARPVPEPAVPRP